MRNDDWVRYSSLGLEMAVIVAGFVLAGVAIDKRRSGTFPLFTILLSFSGIAIAIYFLCKSTDVGGPEKKK